MNLRRNSLFSAAEVLIGGIGLFLIYRSVVAELGVAMLGVWSIVLATTTFGRVADVGIAAGLSKFIATARGRQEYAQVSLYFWTGLSTIAALMGIIALLGWLPLSAALGFALSGAELAAARQLLPWALFTFWLLNINAGLAATLLGIQRSDLRAVSSIGGMSIQVVASCLLVKSHGLLGLAWAQAAQYIFTIAASTIFARKSGAILDPPRFSLLVLKELFGFGAKLQIGTIANLLFEPLSKLVLGAVAGPALVGIFEMAYRMVYQIRSVAIMALQNLVPAFAELSQRDFTASSALFIKSNRVAALAGGALMITAICAAPFVSVLWLQTYSDEFMMLVAMISVCWLINILCAPSYFWGIAHSTINANICGQLITGILSPALAYILANQYGPTAAVIGILAGKSLGDILPALFNRPTSAWSSAGVAQPCNFLALAATIILAILTYSLSGRMVGNFLLSHNALKLIMS